MHNAEYELLYEPPHPHRCGTPVEDYQLGAIARCECGQYFLLVVNHDVYGGHGRWKPISERRARRRLHKAQVERLRSDDA